MIPEICNRRSIRKFLGTPISEEDMTDIIQSGMKAPSSKNRQPWKYILVQGNAKEEMLKVFRRGIEREENESALLPESKQHIAAAKHTVDIMAEAPVIVFVLNTLGKNILEELTPEEHVYEICNIQSISASIQNMLLTATKESAAFGYVIFILHIQSYANGWTATDSLLPPLHLATPMNFQRKDRAKGWKIYLSGEDKRGF